MSRPATDVKDVGAFFFIVNEDDEMRCKVCRKELYGSERKFNNGMCWYCEEDAKDPDPYVDDSLNEVNMGRFDDDPPEHM